MKDYELTITVQVQAPDTISKETVMQSVMSFFTLKETLIDAEKDISVNDICKEIRCLTLSDTPTLDEVMELIQSETKRSEKVNAQLEAYNKSLGVEDKPKEKPLRQQKTVIKDVAEVFAKCTVIDNILKLPTEQLDRKIYEDVKKQLEAVGGHWKGGKTQGFIFDAEISASDVLVQLQSGKDYAEAKKEFQFFATPDEVATEIVSHIDLKDDMKILEPSAGRGTLIKALQKQLPTAKVDCYEAMPENRKYLEALQNVTIIGEDFLQSDLSVKYDVIVANPPFSKNQDVTHVLRMYEHLKCGGRLVAIMSPHWQHAQDKKSKQFREFLQSVGGQTYEIAEGAFKQSGTNIRTYYVVIDKPEEKTVKTEKTYTSYALF